MQKSSIKQKQSNIKLNKKILFFLSPVMNIYFKKAFINFFIKASNFRVDLEDKKNSILKSN